MNYKDTVRSSGDVYSGEPIEKPEHPSITKKFDEIKKSMMEIFFPPLRTLDKMTEEELFYITNLATGGYFNGEWSKDRKEVECGGYNRRRRIEWTMNLEGYDEYHYFEISSENKTLSWQWHCKSTYTLSKLYGTPNWCESNTINVLDMAGIVDYCDKQKLDIRNKNLK
jgi:hypothetical protein